MRESNRRHNHKAESNARMVSCEDDRVVWECKKDGYRWATKTPEISFGGRIENGRYVPPDNHIHPSDEEVAL